ncbi:hypothetical protein G7007_04500 [Pseudomonas entomophila]|uniref:hypothetical protein n=1 Tax=Pseudomonas entomophila TaxID=312306 RepID=UPI0015E34175|nr:hypothetical protein [Pseudomonas entomophila]MBA1192126.1 hypothetical protein [Pseudomonas entomophila]
MPSPLTSNLNALSIGAGNYIEVVSSPADGWAWVKVMAGATYTFSVYVRGSDAPGFLRMYPHFLDTDGGVLGESFACYTSAGTSLSRAT